ncbi:MAG: TonB-dependent receptor, partial [Calditrichaeota bacterium]
MMDTYPLMTGPIRRLLLIGWGLLFPLMMPAQEGSVVGRVVDEANQPLPGANVYLEGTFLGSATNDQGQFEILQVPPGTYTLVVSMLSYQQKRISLTVPPEGPVDVGTIQLSPSAIEGTPVVVTAGKYEQQLQDIPASIGLVDRKDIQFRNNITLDQALEYVSGVNLTGGQVNIRGSSGYSRGVGSRVLFLLDGVPLLTGDTRDIIYELVPTYLIDRIEVLKGAASALYGSSALGGVINVITRPIEQPAYYKVKLFGGLYSRPVHPQWRFTEEERFLNGARVTYARRMGKVGIQVGATRDEDDSYRQNDWRKRWTGGGKVQWEITPYQRLTLAGNYMWQKRGNFLYWRGLDHPLQPPDDQLDDWVITRRYYLTGNYRLFFDKRRFLTVRGIYFWSRFRDNVSVGGNLATSQNATGEVQYNTDLGKLFVTTGVEGTYNRVESNIFGNRSGTNLAVYAQGELPLSEKWLLSLGVRFDVSAMDSADSRNQVNPKLGLVFKPGAGSAIRVGFGTGFRAPSLGEAFTSTSAGGLQVVPNPHLKPERSYYAELGWNHIAGEWLIFDGAVFYNRFTDLIDPTFTRQAQIRFVNITDARVVGGEVTVKAALFRKHLRLHAGYTYVDPRDLEQKQYLNFRPRHVLITGGQLYLWKVLTLGVDYRFISRYDRIDERFALVIKDSDARVPVHVVDARVMLAFKVGQIPFRTSLQMNNLLRYNYIDLVGSLAKLRHFILTLETDW